MARHSGITIGDRICAYLDSLDVRERTDRDVWPWEATQDGIAQSIGISRAHVALEMKRLSAQGRIDAFRAHVKDGKTRRFVYRRASRPDVYAANGARVPVTRGRLHQMTVVYLRCPSCGREARVALGD